MDSVHNSPDGDPGMSRDEHASDPPPPRATYRHGDLRRALLEAGIEQARAGGPDAVVLREATRRAGVVPNAAYRHFSSRDDLLEAVRAAALSAVAEAIEAELDHAKKKRDPAAAARARLRAIGTAYVRFAQREPGLFRTAFSASDRRPARGDLAMAGPSGLNPFELLGSVLDEMVAARALPKARRPGAEYIAWSTVHGLAMLLIDGPLRAMPTEEREHLVAALLDMVEQGLA
jgi:AcrR family transcriptional regulator